MPASAGIDPLADVISLVAGVLLALSAVGVPVALVLGESQPPAASQRLRSGW